METNNFWTFDSYKLSKDFAHFHDVDVACDSITATQFHNIDLFVNESNSIVEYFRVNCIFWCNLMRVIA